MKLGLYNLLWIFYFILILFSLVFVPKYSFLIWIFIGTIIVAFSEFVLVMYLHNNPDKSVNLFGMRLQAPKETKIKFLDKDAVRWYLYFGLFFMFLLLSRYIIARYLLLAIIIWIFIDFFLVIYLKKTKKTLNFLGFKIRYTS